MASPIAARKITIYFPNLGLFLYCIKYRVPIIKSEAKATHINQKSNVEINNTITKKPKNRYTKCKPSRYKGNIKAKYRMAIPGSGCNKMRIAGIKIIAKAFN